MPPRKTCPRAIGGRGTQRPGPSQRPLSSVRPELVEGSQERKRGPGAQAKDVIPEESGTPSPLPAPGGLNVLAHPNASPLPRRSDRPVALLRREQVAAQAKDVTPETSLPPRRRGSGTPSPPPQSRPITFPCPPGDGKTPWIEATADRPFPAERPSRRPVRSELALYQEGVAGRLSPTGTSSRRSARRRACAIYQARGRWAA